MRVFDGLLAPRERAMSGAATFVAAGVPTPAEDDDVTTRELSPVSRHRISIFENSIFNTLYSFQFL